MPSGIYKAERKDKTTYYRANIYFKGKHISLGSYENADEAYAVHLSAAALLNDQTAMLPDAFFKYPLLNFEKIVILLNYRDHHMYLGTPIYLMHRYFLYYLAPDLELKFDTDDLFYYSSHRILKRGGHLYVNEYGMQTSLLSRYGIRSYAVEGKDYRFVNGDTYDYRYENIENINPFYGVSKIYHNSKPAYLAQIHIRGNYQIGIYDSDVKAAIAYNKAVDLGKTYGIDKNYPTNYIPALSASAYADLYTAVHLSKSLRNYYKSLPISQDHQ